MTTRVLVRPLPVREPGVAPYSLRVLVVDDDEEMRNLLRRSLEFDGHHVTERDRGSQVLRTLRDSTFDLVILDNLMPGLNGLELLPTLRREFPAVPILLVTAFGGRQTASSALRLGAASYLEKPFRLGQLRDAIAGLISDGGVDASAG